MQKHQILRRLATKPMSTKARGVQILCLFVQRLQVWVALALISHKDANVP